MAEQRWCTYCERTGCDFKMGRMGCGHEGQVCGYHYPETLSNHFCRTCTNSQPFCANPRPLYKCLMCNAAYGGTNFHSGQEMNLVIQASCGHAGRGRNCAFAIPFINDQRNYYAVAMCNLNPNNNKCYACRTMEVGFIPLMANNDDIDDSDSCASYNSDRCDDSEDDYNDDDDSDDSDSDSCASAMPQLDDPDLPPLEDDPANATPTQRPTSQEAAAFLVAFSSECRQLCAATEAFASAVLAITPVTIAPAPAPAPLPLPPTKVEKYVREKFAFQAQLRYIRAELLNQHRPQDLYTMLDVILNGRVLEAADAAPLCQRLATHYSNDWPHVWCQTLCFFVGDYWNIALSEAYFHTCHCYIRGIADCPPATIDKWLEHRKHTRHYLMGQLQIAASPQRP
jgi:hypothetical protein